MIKLLVERSLRDVSQMAWVVFEDILQFRFEDAPVVEELAAQEEDIGKTTSPRVSVGNEPPVAKEALTVIEDVVVETNIERPSTHLQRGATYFKRKGKEVETIDAEGGTMV